MTLLHYGSRKKVLQLSCRLVLAVVPVNTLKNYQKHTVDKHVRRNMPLQERRIKTYKVISGVLCGFAFGFSGSPCFGCHGPLSVLYQALKATKHFVVARGEKTLSHEHLIILAPPKTWKTILACGSQEKTCDIDMLHG